MECGAKGSSSIAGRCIGAAMRHCGQCGAVADCSTSHQVSHWNEHKEECERLEQQMRRVDVLHDFPFTFSKEATVQICEKRRSRCSFLMDRSLHKVGMWKYECNCSGSSLSCYSRVDDEWSLPSDLFPCCGAAMELMRQGAMLTILSTLLAATDFIHNKWLIPVGVVCRKGDSSWSSYFDDR